jgi:exoribonuclease R
MVDEFLALYSEACRRFCDGHRVAVPLAAGSANARFDALRFGTGPLRRYADVLAQRQVSHTLSSYPQISTFSCLE